MDQRNSPEGSNGDSKSNQNDKDSVKVSLPILNQPSTRRTALKVAGAALGLAAFGTAVSPLWKTPEDVSVEEFLQQHYKELSEDEKQKVSARLEAEAKEDHGVDVSISDPQPIPGVRFGYAINLSKCNGNGKCMEACNKENNHHRGVDQSYIRVLEMGVAAGGVMMVIPAYLYHDKKMHDVVIIGETLAIAAIVMCLLFVVVDLGRPERFWHLIPFGGRFNWPMSMLTWDVIVLNGYLLLNLHICGYLLYMRFLGRQPDKRWYVPFVWISIFWAISIHTVTAFLYCGLGGRPFWNTALLAPRFLASAFVAGPAFILILFAVIRRVTGETFDAPQRILINIIRVTVVVNLLMVVSEVFTEFYTGGGHTASARYLYLGLHGHNALVPWIWTATVFNVVSAVLFLSPLVRRSSPVLIVSCVLAFVGAWIEKGMGLIVPGFIPSTLHEIVEYTPSLTEWKVSVGIWAFGLMVLTILLKMSMVVISSRPQSTGDGESSS